MLSYLSNSGMCIAVSIICIDHKAQFYKYVLIFQFFTFNISKYSIIPYKTLYQIKIHVNPNVYFITKDKHTSFKYPKDKIFSIENK